jgi:gas vesicle protein
MTSNTEHLQKQIDQTQQDIRDDLTALQDKLSPSSAMRRTAERVEGTFESARETVMGRAQEGAEQAGEAVSEMPKRLEERTNGNPLAMGLLAFSAGWLIGSLIPATSIEKRQAENLRDKAAQAVEPVVESAKDFADSVKQEATETAQSVAAQAKDSATAVKEASSGDNDPDGYRPMEY